MTVELFEEIEKCRTALEEKSLSANLSILEYMKSYPADETVIIYESLRIAIESIYGRTAYSSYDDRVVVSLTGHRPDKLAGYDMSHEFYSRLKSRLAKIIEDFLAMHEIVECHSGMALGADTIWAQLIVECKRKYGRRIRFVADIPDRNQSKLWPLESHKLWQELLDQADEIIEYAHNHQGRSYAYILNQRNIGMIKACDYLIAVYNGDRFGGTANGVKDGERLMKKMIYLHPDGI